MGFNHNLELLNEAFISEKVEDGEVHKSTKHELLKNLSNFVQDLDNDINLITIEAFKFVEL